MVSLMKAAEVGVSDTPQKVNQPLQLALSHSVRSIPLNKIEITPNTEGEWHYEKMGMFDDDELVFVPKSTFVVGTKYSVRLPTVDRPILKPITFPEVKFTTESAPGLADDGLASYRDNQVVAADGVFSVMMTAQNRGLRKLELRTIPAVKLDLQVTDDQQYIWMLIHSH